VLVRFRNDNPDRDLHSGEPVEREK
jgi:hypothetical protein